MVLEEYLVRFVAMIQAARVIEAQDKLDLITIFSVPYMKSPDSRKIMDSFIKIINEDEDVSPERIRRDRRLLLKKLKGKVI